MNRKAFLLGLYSVGGQVLLLRELVSSLNGDELFIGTALFGWLIAVAIGAYLGGLKIQVKPVTLFIFGGFLLPVSIIAARFYPMLTTQTVGEIVPFTSAAIMSMTAMVPVGIVAGWLFTAIAREGYRPAVSILRAYLFEGIGAFVGGLMVMALAGPVYSTFGLALVLVLTVLGLYYLPARPKGIVGLAAIMMTLLVALWLSVPSMDEYFDRQKYKSFEIEKSFDTHYSHQAILSRAGSLTLLTDNTVEATYPDIWTAENMLIPPLLYKPDSKKILYIGRAELGLTQMADSIGNIELTAVDPREELSGILNEYFPTSNSLSRKDNDAVKYFYRDYRKMPVTRYDIIILRPGFPDSYKNARFFTDRFAGYARQLLSPGGIFYFVSEYDTDRYIGPEEKVLLAVINNSLKLVFRNVSAWPGENTLFFASDSNRFDTQVDELIARIDSLDYKAVYLNESHILDRLNSLKVDRLKASMESSQSHHTIGKPIIARYQALFRSGLNERDKKIIPVLFNEALWIIVSIIIVLGLFVILIIRRPRRRFFGLFLYFTAGIVSLTLELISFYLYQSSAGSLYAEMAILIGIFMLGLALGTYYSCRIDRENLEFPALLLLFTAAILFLSTYDRIGISMKLYYYVLFLFTIALATGSLFVAATDRYYFGKVDANRGMGYAFEILGSSLGALLVLTILLPIVGLYWLLVSIIILIFMALIGSFLTAR